MIIFTRADESRRGITHADAETSGAWRHDHDHIIQNIQATRNVELQGVVTTLQRSRSEWREGEGGPHTQCKQFATKNEFLCSIGYVYEWMGFNWRIAYKYLYVLVSENNNDDNADNNYVKLAKLLPFCSKWNFWKTKFCAVLVSLCLKNWNYKNPWISSRYSKCCEFQVGVIYW